MRDASLAPGPAAGEQAPLPDPRQEIRSIELGVAMRDVPESARVLEIGAGAGWQARELARRGFDVIAFDLPSSRYRDQQVWPVGVFDGSHLPVAAGSVDVVFTSHVMEHVEDFESLLAEMERVLRPGGFAVHVLPSPTWRGLTIVTKYLVAVRALSKRRRGATRRSRGIDEPSASKATPDPGTSTLARLAIPSRHGCRGNAFTELYLFSSRAWRRRFRRAGWRPDRPLGLGVAYSGNHFFAGSLDVPARRRMAKVLGSSSYRLVTRPRRSS